MAAIDRGIGPGIVVVPAETGDGRAPALEVGVSGLVQSASIVPPIAAS